MKRHLLQAIELLFSCLDSVKQNKSLVIHVFQIKRVEPNNKNWGQLLNPNDGSNSNCGAGSENGFDSSSGSDTIVDPLMDPVCRFQFQFCFQKILES